MMYVPKVTGPAAVATTKKHTSTEIATPVIVVARLDVKQCRRRSVKTGKLMQVHRKARWDDVVIVPEEQWANMLSCLQMRGE